MLMIMVRLRKEVELETGSTIVSNMLPYFCFSSWLGFPERWAMRWSIKHAFVLSTCFSPLFYYSSRRKGRHSLLVFHTNFHIIPVGLPRSPGLVECILSTSFAFSSLYPTDLGPVWISCCQSMHLLPLFDLKTPGFSSPAPTPFSLVIFCFCFFWACPLTCISVGFFLLGLLTLFGKPLIVPPSTYICEYMQLIFT